MPDTVLAALIQACVPREPACSAASTCETCTYKKHYNDNVNYEIEYTDNYNQTQQFVYCKNIPFLHNYVMHLLCLLFKEYAWSWPKWRKHVA